MKWKFGRSLSDRTLLGLVLGTMVGFYIGPKIVAIQFIGDIFLRLLQMAIVPLIYFSVTAAIANIGDIKRLGRIGGKTFLLFLSTSVSAGIFGIVISRIIHPGRGLTLHEAPPANALAEAPSVVKILTGVVPTNIVQAMSEANMLQVILFAFVSGAAILLLDEPERIKVHDWFETCFKFVMKILNLVIQVSPIGVFGLMAVTAGKYGANVIGPLTKFIVTCYVGWALHLVLFMFVIYFLFTRKNPWTFFRGISEIWLTSVSTCSTKATMPIAMSKLEEQGIPKSITGFVVPLGASTNMDGSSMWYGVVAIFVAEMIGINMSWTQQLMTLVVGVVLTLGGTGIPGGTFVTTAVFLKTMGLPLEVMGLLGGIYRLVDMGLTTINVLGTVFVTAIVGHLEGPSTREPSLPRSATSGTIA